jgi:hypothetical protein
VFLVNHGVVSCAGWWLVKNGSATEAFPVTMMQSFYQKALWQDFGVGARQLQPLTNTDALRLRLRTQKEASVSEARP